MNPTRTRPTKVSAARWFAPLSESRFDAVMLASYSSRMAALALSLAWMTGCDCSQTVPFRLTPDRVTRGERASIVAEFEEAILDPSESTGAQQGLRITLVETAGSRAIIFYASDPAGADPGLSNVVVLDSQRVGFDLELPADWRPGPHDVAINIGWTQSCTNQGSWTTVTAQ